MEHVIGISMLYHWLKMSVMNTPFNLEYVLLMTSQARTGPKATLGQYID